MERKFLEELGIQTRNADGTIRKMEEIADDIGATNDKIVHLSKLHPKCKKCKHKNACDNKRMVACGILPIKTEVTQPITQPILRGYTPITINMGEYGTIDTILEEIKEQLNKEYYIGVDLGLGEIK